MNTTTLPADVYAEVTQKIARAWGDAEGPRGTSASKQIRRGIQGHYEASMCQQQIGLLVRYARAAESRRARLEAAGAA